MAWRLTKSFFLSSLNAPCFFAPVSWRCQFSINTQSSWRYLNLSMFLAHPENEYYCLFHSVDFWRHLWFSSRSVLLLNCFQAAFELMARIFTGSSPIWVFTFFQAPRFFPCLNDTSRSTVKVIGVRISRRYGGPWLILVSL